MDHPASAADGDAREDEKTSIPNVRQVVVRALPAAALTMIGVPVIVWLLVDATGQATLPWLPLLIVALLGLAAFVHYCMAAPRPHVDDRVSTREVSGAMSYTSKSRTAPTDARVRAAAVVSACADVEITVFAGAFLLGGGLAALIRPEFPWLDASLYPAAIALIFAFKARHGWSYLQVLHSESRVG